MFDLIFVTLFVAGWSICGIVPWLALSIATRGQAGLIYLPLTIFAANVGGMAVPVLGLDTGRGMAVSFLVALAVPTALLIARRMSLVDAPGVAAVHGAGTGDAGKD
jgi:hypothetical protein